MEKNNLFFLTLFVITLGLVYILINQVYNTGGFIYTLPDCFDSDNGKAYGVQGYVQYSSWEWIWKMLVVKEDSCEGAFLLEYYCGSKGIGSSDKYLCPSGCKDGACVQQTKLTGVCTDSDGGINYNSRGVLSIFTEAGGDAKTYSDFCKNSTSLMHVIDMASALGEGPILNEMYCVDNVTHSFKEYSCPEGCKDGVCLPPVIKDNTRACGDGRCVWPEDKANCPRDCFCKDSDKGLDYYNPGSVTAINDLGDSVVMYDYCSSGKVGGKKQITEWYCRSDSGIADSKTVGCDYGCVNGACINQEIPKTGYTTYDLYIGSYVLAGGHKIRVTGMLENGSVVANVDGVEGKVDRVSGSVVNGVPLQIMASGVVSKRTYVALRVFGGFKCVEGYSRCVMDTISQCSSGQWVDVKSCGNDAGHCDTQGSNALCLISGG